jgi:spore coat protein A, manganese oxidase
MLSRRELIKLGFYGGGTGLLHLSGAGSRLAWAFDSVTNLPPSPPSTPFQVPLPIPPVKTPVQAATLPGVPIFNDGFPTTYYDITMRQAPIQIFQKGSPTVIWGYDGLYPGPTINARIEERIVVRQHNQLPANTIVHHHGGHTESASDGSALVSEEIPPNTFRDFLYANDDDIAATHWYHDHDIDFTGHNVYMGLAAFYLLDDDGEDALNLPGSSHDPAPPGEYPFEVALVFQDRVFDANNQLVYNPFDHDGFLGDKFLVNGAIQPRMRVANRKYRFHVLDGANARYYQLSMSNGMPFHVIGSDGGLLKQRVDVSNFRIGMAERVEFILDFSNVPVGSQIVLNNIMQQTNGRGPDGINPKAAVPLMRFDVQFSVPDPSSNPVTLRTDLPVFNPNDATQTINLEFDRSDGAWQINGKFFDPNRIDNTIKLNSTVIWNLKNGGGGWFHPIHIHRNQFSILSRNGQPPSAIEGGLKDVFVLAGGDQVSVITKFTGARGPTGTDALGPYVYHCHNLEHEDMRMMGVFNVVR